MRNKSVYSCSIKIYASEFSELLKSIFCLLLVVEAFFMQKVVRMLGGRLLVRGQVNMADEAKLHSSVHSTLEVLVVWRVVGHCWRRIGPFLLTNAAGLVIFSASHLFAEHTSLMNVFARTQEAMVDQTATDRQWPWPFYFGASLSLGLSSKKLWIFLSVQPLRWSLPVVT